MSNSGHASILTAEQIADLLGVPHSTINQWRRLGIGPPAVKVAGGWLYRRQVVVTWLRAGAPSLDPVPAELAHRMADQLCVPLGVDAPLERLPA